MTYLPPMVDQSATQYIVDINGRIEQSVVGISDFHFQLYNNNPQSLTPKEIIITLRASIDTIAYYYSIINKFNQLLKLPFEQRDDYDHDVNMPIMITVADEMKLPIITVKCENTRFESMHFESVLTNCGVLEPHISLHFAAWSELSLVEEATRDFT